MEGKRFIETIRLENILSYGPNSPVLRLEPLNVLIGPNASGKSNFIEALSILKAAPRDIQEPFRGGGGVREWLWKGSQGYPTASVETTIASTYSSIPLMYWLSFGNSIFSLPQLEVQYEQVKDLRSSSLGEDPYSYYEYRGGSATLKTKVGITPEQRLEGKDVSADQSILSQRRDSFSFPELTHLAFEFERMYFYREFPLGRNSPLRLPQQADLPQHALAEDASNLAVILSYLQNQPQARRWIQHHMQEFYPSIRNVHSLVLGGTVQIFFEEEGLHTNVPATRLSDGSLRYLCLLVALYNPSPPSVICIEEPEAGLHPDAIPSLAKLLVAASKRSQIIVTTHSDILVDALSDTPEAVVICEKVDGATQLRRLNADDLKVWLEKYRLGELWTRGHIGGNLW